MDKKDRFKIINDDTELDNKIVDSINIVDIPKEVSVDKIKEENIKEENIKEDDDENSFDKTYVGFGTRIFIMIVISLVLFGIAFLLIRKTIDYKSKEKINYTQNSNVSYEVCTNEKSAFCLDEDMLYNSSKIKNIKATFNYNINLSKSVYYDLTYHISAITMIYDKKNPSKILYNNEEVLVDKVTISDTKEEFNIYKDVTYDYFSKNRYVISYKDVYDDEYIADVKIALYIDDDENSREVASITASLNSNSFNIIKSTAIDTEKELVIQNSSWNSYTIMFAVMASLLIIIALILVLRVTRLVLKVTNTRTKYQQKMMQILKEYDRIIVIARDGYETNKDREVVKLNSFDELLDIKDNLSKPIIFSKVSEVKCEFIVEDEDILYKYVLKDDNV